MTQIKTDTFRGTRLSMAHASRTSTQLGHAWWRLLATGSRSTRGTLVGHCAPSGQGYPECPRINLPPKNKINKIKTKGGESSMSHQCHVHEDSKWVNRRNKNVYAKVKLEVVYEEGFGKVLLYKHRVVRGYVFRISCQRNPTMTSSHRNCNRT